MNTAYIGFGSNIDPEQNIPSAIRMLSRHVNILAISTIYLTEPLGDADSPQFYNGVLKIKTSVQPRQLKFEVLRKIENAHGRTRTRDKYAPRSIDLDIIVYEDLVVCEPDLVIPDPDIYDRVFIAVPLLELSPEMILPDTGMRLADIAKTLHADTMTPLAEFTAALRKEIIDEH